jgi:hypothetical protein
MAKARQVETAIEVKTSVPITVVSFKTRANLVNHQQHGQRGPWSTPRDSGQHAPNQPADLKTKCLRGKRFFARPGAIEVQYPNLVIKAERSEKFLISLRISKSQESDRKRTLPGDRW